MGFVSALAEKLRRDEHAARLCREKKVSPGFLAVVIEANLAEIVDEWAEHARECGELGCPQCDEFFPFDRVRVGEDGAALCPDCGGRLGAEVCAGCGGPIDGPGVWKDGLCYCCPGCAR